MTNSVLRFRAFYFCFHLCKWQPMLVCFRWNTNTSRLSKRLNLFQNLPLNNLWTCSGVGNVGISKRYFVDIQIVYLLAYKCTGQWAYMPKFKAGSVRPASPSHPNKNMPPTLCWTDITFIRLSVRTRSWANRYSLLENGSLQRFIKNDLVHVLVFYA